MSTSRYILVEEDFQKQVLNELADIKAMFKANNSPSSRASSDEDELMDTVDMQNYLKCCRRTLLKHRKAGMPFVQKENGRIYYWKSQVSGSFLSINRQTD